jgi:radical SAM protein with 4Fe4S-binding SPASM domain
MGILGDINEFRSEYGSGIVRGGLTSCSIASGYAFNTLPKKGPIFIGWEITFKCNSRCSYCSRWKQGLNSKNELNTEEAIRIIRQLGKHGVWIISFGGGEPLLRNDISILVREIKRQKMNANICTNGSLLKQKAKELVDSGVDTITVSVESIAPAIHDKMRKIKGSFKMLTEGIEEVKKFRKGKRPLIKVRMNVTKENCFHIGEYIDHWRGKVDSLIIQPIHECKVTSFHIPDELNFSDKDKGGIEIYFKKLSKKYKEMSKKYYKEFPDFFFDKKKLFNKYKCFAGYFFMQIDPYGNVYPCTEYITNVGNLRKESFESIWRGSKLKKFRGMVRKHEQPCFCWYNCNGTLNCYLSSTIGKLRIR